MAERLKKEQINPQYLPVHHRRASATQTTAHPPASPHYAGHDAGLHGEDAPYTTRDHPRRTVQPHHSDEEDDDALYEQRPPNSARRYLQPQEVYTQGNRKIVVHREPPPQRRVHWMLFAGIALFIMVVGWVAFSAVGYWWWQQQENWKYGTPRTFQIDQFVGHGDSPDHPDHFIAVNTGGMIEVVELNGMNHDGKIDLLVTIGESNPYTVVLLNTGTQFTH